METIAELNEVAQSPVMDERQVPDKIAREIEKFIAISISPWRRIPIIKSGKHELCQALLARGVPMVITIGTMQGGWSPSRLSQLYGNILVEVLDSRSATGTPISMRLADYLTEFEKLSEVETPNHTLKLRVCTSLHLHDLNALSTELTELGLPSLHRLPKCLH